MKNYLLTYTFAQACLLIAILLILAIGCENQGKTPVVLHPVDTDQFATEHSRIPDIDTTDVILKMAKLNIKRLGWVITATQHLETLHGKEYDRYFHYAQGIQNSYTDSIIDLENMIGHHELDKLRPAHSEIGKDGDR